MLFIHCSASQSSEGISEMHHVSNQSSLIWGPHPPATHLCTPHEEKIQNEDKWLQRCTRDSSGTSMHILFFISPFTLSCLCSSQQSSETLIADLSIQEFFFSLSARWGAFPYRILALIWHIVCFRSAREGIEEHMRERDREREREGERLVVECVCQASFFWC